MGPDRDAAAAEVRTAGSALTALAGIVSFVLLAVATAGAARLGSIGGGPGEACVHRDAPAAFSEGAAVSGEPSWFPLGVTCVRSTAQASLTQSPSWAATILVLGALGGAAACFVLLLRGMRSTPRGARTDDGVAALGFADAD